MSQKIAEKWNQRFREANSPNEPAEVLRQNLHLLPPRGRALELACGLGGNALLLAQSGLAVEALDISEVALQKLDEFAASRALTIDTRQCDIENHWRPTRSYDVIVCCHYLHRPLCAQIQSALARNGLLYYQTFTRDKIDAIGPNTADFLLQTNELLALFNQLELVFYREDRRSGDLSRGLRNCASLVGRKP
jgi:2-polyprenyl-3-methyl-5-hydroxy-6-metoxy-1,4-benzoquinol methylase